MARFLESLDLLLAWLRSHFPFLFSPRWQGVFITALFILAGDKHWLDESWMRFFATIAGIGTGIGIWDNALKKVTKPRTVELSPTPVPVVPVDAADLPPVDNSGSDQQP